MTTDVVKAEGLIREIQARSFPAEAEYRSYAEREAIRHSGPGRAYAGTVKWTPQGPRWTGKILLAGDKLDQPCRGRNRGGSSSTP